MPRGHLIDSKGIKRLREDHEILLKRVTHLEQKISVTKGSGRRRMNEFVKVTTQIDPRDISSSSLEKTLGTGKAELYKIGKDAADNNKVKFSQMKDAQGEAIEVDVYNSSIVPVPVDAYIRIRRDFRSGLWMVGEVQTAVAKAGSSGVAARSGTSAGDGEVTIYSIVSGVLTSTGKTVYVYNLSATAVADDAYITIKRCSLDEVWIVDAEDCG
tara:strand:- start:1594 stop:2232 length:639 start_codon:yes stop_codon:yes gene_type:complete